MNIEKKCVSVATSKPNEIEVNNRHLINNQEKLPLILVSPYFSLKLLSFVLCLFTEKFTIPQK